MANRMEKNGVLLTIFPPNNDQDVDGDGNSNSRSSNDNNTKKL